MQPIDPNSHVTTIAAVIGGFSKAVLGRFFLLAITIQSIAEVAVYAGTSALVGLAVKLTIDLLKKAVNSYKNNKRHHHE